MSVYNISSINNIDSQVSVFDPSIKDPGHGRSEAQLMYQLVKTITRGAMGGSDQYRRDESNAVLVLNRC